MRRRRIVVAAVLAALARVRCPVNVVGLIAAAENSVGGEALRPGDVVRHYGGRTSEGAGLGLAIVQAIATAHGGRATVAGSGEPATVVRISMPLS